MFHATTAVNIAIVIAKNSARTWNNKKFVKLIELSNIAIARGTAQAEREKYVFLGSFNRLSKKDILFTPYNCKPYMIKAIRAVTITLLGDFHRNFKNFYIILANFEV